MWFEHSGLPLRHGLTQGIPCPIPTSTTGCILELTLTLSKPSWRLSIGSLLEWPEDQVRVLLLYFKWTTRFRVILVDHTVFSFCAFVDINHTISPLLNVCSLAVGSVSVSEKGGESLRDNTRPKGETVHEPATRFISSPTTQSSMSDSFADLWNSSTPSNNAQNQPKPKLGTPQVTVKRPQYDAFSILSSTSANTSRPASGQSNAASAKVLASASARPQLSATTSKSSDAFSELFSNSAQSKMQNMTMAERAAAAKAEQQKQAMSTYGNPSSSSSSGNNAWAGLDSLASTGSNTADASHDDWDLGLNPTTGPTVANPIVASGSFDDDDDWGLGNGFNATSTTSSRSPVPAPPPQKPVSANIWDELDEFSSQPSRTNGSRDSPSNDFDFGDRENGFVASATDARHDDILGDLAKPVEEIRRSSPAATVCEYLSIATTPC